MRRHCYVSSCGREAVGHGFCQKHNWRRRTYGDPTYDPRDPVRRFWTRVAPGENACWEWTGDKSRDGYGKFHHHRTRLAHRWIYEYMVADIPPGLELDHLCHNPGCVNPWHLEPVTAAVNSSRRGGIFA